MNLQFNIDYQTYYGQDLVLNIVTGLHGGSIEASQYRMHTGDGHRWSVDINRDVKPGTQIDYFYTILRGDYEERREWSTFTHRLVFDAERGQNYRIFDHWNDIPDNAYLYTSRS